jgi:NRAMP (natural resistance-associated macrophage protein)-like metal ion transporter
VDAFAEPRPRARPFEATGGGRRRFAFLGAAALVSVGYIDPGNWATDIEGGARFGYQLLWVLVGSGLIATLLQTLSARLGVVTGWTWRRRAVTRMTAGSGYRSGS